jgi:hypothetical protein
MIGDIIFAFRATWYGLLLAIGLSLAVALRG